MEVLTELTLRDNPISYLPPSFAKMKNLVKLVMVRNRLKELPEDIGNMKQLQILDLSSNELKFLPVSICDCPSLQILHLDDNHLIRLPENLGFLPQLKSLSINVNHLTALPFSLGYCSTLRTLSCNENLVTDPPMAEFSKGLELVLWYMRNRFMIEKHGKPPQMEYHEIGIAHEVTILKPEFEETIQQKMIGAQKDGILNLQLLGLREIPKLILSMKTLKRLKLDFNDYLDVSQGFPPELHRLQALSFRGCKLPVLPNNIHIFDRLTNLNLEDNRLEWLPESFCELLSLTSLNLSKNHLYRLPDAFHHLTALQTLLLESNYLEDLCENFEALVDLKVLNLGKNRLAEVPDVICHLETLRVLNLEKNKLCTLPPYISRLSLVDLRVGHNRIECLADDIFALELGESVRLFSCVENNLLELPTSLSLLDITCTLEADYNPLISPPQYLLSDGLQILKNYMAIRASRRRLLLDLMLDEDFELVEKSFSPVACEVLEDGTGFLTPDDLAAFDQAVQEYMNGEYFKCPATGEEIVARVTKLRDDREIEMYLRIIYAFLEAIHDIVVVRQDPAFNESSIFETQRPWGRNGELANCWVISLAALLRESNPNMFYPEGRPSIFNIIHQKLPQMVFPFTVDLLKDSIRLYISPYGPVADTEQVTFPSCDCVDDVRGKPKRHDPCQKAAVVIAKSVYTDEEADRREVEEDEFLERFETVEDDVRIWLVTDEGRKCLEKEVKKRKAVLREEVSLREEMLLAQQMKHKKKIEELKGLKGRLELFLMAAPYEQHGFYTEEEAKLAIDKVEVEIRKFQDRIKILQAIVQGLKEKLMVDWKTSCINAASDIVQKYCVLAYNEAVTSFRRKALDNGWKRHWDGTDGVAFSEWCRHHITTKKNEGQGEDDEDQQDISGTRRPTSASSVRSDNSAGSTHTTASARKRNANGELDPEFNWDDTTKMEKFNLSMYFRYRETNGFSFVPR
jgi:Leucine-rich repeat (LRR) protein